jgi:uncharacterized protein
VIAGKNIQPDFSKFGPIGLVVIQSTSLCNLDCSYCYLPDRQKKRVFDLDLIPLLIERILESPYAGPEFSLVWHAGEPLTLPTSWYDKATTLINKSLERLGAQDLEIDQHVQTNATLINDDWCNCFRRNKIVVGISVDGPEDIHDSHRRFRNGRGSHAMAMRGIEALHRNQVPFHCISVITADAMEQPERMYRGFIEITASMMWASMLKRRKESIHRHPWQAPSWKQNTKTFSAHFGVSVNKTAIQLSCANLSR